MIDLGKSSGLKRVIAKVTWEQPEHKGFGGALRNKLNRTDVDLSAVVFAGATPFDYADPKTHTTAADGAVVHAGDARNANGGGEEIVINLADIADDVTAVAFILSCATGSFNKITNTKVEFLNEDSVLLGRQRFSVMTDDNGAAIGYLRRNAGEWSYVESLRYGRVDYAKWATGQAWRDLYALANNAVR